MNNALALNYTGAWRDPLVQGLPLGNGYRTYLPDLMRFQAPDSLSPFGKGGINPYAYCRGDPINFSDPSGHISVIEAVGIAIGILSILLLPFSMAASGTLALAYQNIALGAMAAVAGVVSNHTNGKLHEVMEGVSFLTGGMSLISDVFILYVNAPGAWRFIRNMCVPKRTAPALLRPTARLPARGAVTNSEDAIEISLASPVTESTPSHRKNQYTASALDGGAPLSQMQTPTERAEGASTSRLVVAEVHRSANPEDLDDVSRILGEDSKLYDDNHSILKKSDSSKMIDKNRSIIIDNFTNRHDQAVHKTESKLYHEESINHKSYIYKDFYANPDEEDSSKL